MDSSESNSTIKQTPPAQLAAQAARSTNRVPVASMSAASFPSTFNYHASGARPKTPLTSASSAVPSSTRTTSCTNSSISKQPDVDVCELKHDLRRNLKSFECPDVVIDASDWMRDATNHVIKGTDNAVSQRQKPSKPSFFARVKQKSYDDVSDDKKSTDKKPTPKHRFTFKANESNSTKADGKDVTAAALRKNKMKIRPRTVPNTADVTPRDGSATSAERQTRQGTTETKNKPKQQRHQPGKLKAKQKSKQMDEMLHSVRETVTKTHEKQPKLKQTQKQRNTQKRDAITGNCDKIASNRGATTGNQGATSGNRSTTTGDRGATKRNRGATTGDRRRSHLRAPSREYGDDANDDVDDVDDGALNQSKHSTQQQRGRIHTSYSLLSGLGKLRKGRVVIVSGYFRRLGISNPDQLHHHVTALLLASQNFIPFKITSLDLAQTPDDVCYSTLELPNIAAATQFVTAVSSISHDVTGRVNAVARELSDSDVRLIVLSHVHEMQWAIAEPMRKHQEKVDHLKNEIDKIKSEHEGVGLSKIGSVFDEIQAHETKLRELKAQNREFIQFLQRTEISYHNLKYEACDIESKAEVLHDSLEHEIGRLKGSLPMYAKRADIIRLIRDNQVCVIIGETGSGKSTQLAQYVHEAQLSNQKLVVCTQPRKVSAMNLAKRVAQEMRCPLGGSGVVGYDVGMNRKVSDVTPICYMTDHVLLRECISDPDLSRYGCVIIDEAHERSIFTDLLLAMIKRLIVRRSELKVIITSATIDPKVFVTYFHGCPVQYITGRTFPVEVHYDDIDHPDDYVSAAILKVRQILDTCPPGDVLVFLTSPLETERACEQLNGQLGHRSSDVILLPLHGQLQSSEQSKVFEPTPAGKRKIVFATNCAETSITIDGIVYVIDTGYAKERAYDTRRSVNALKLMNVTQSSAEQRKGRAGRTRSGVCFRSYTKDAYEKFRQNSTPEIMSMHLGQAFLQLMMMSVQDPLSFDFVESPPRESLEKAAILLEDLGATSDGQLTDFGRQLAKLSLEPRLGKFVLEGIKLGIGLEAVIIAGIYSTGVRLFFRGGSDEQKEKGDKLKTMLCQKEGDVITLLNVYKSWEATDERGKSRYCVTNSLNAKSAKIVRDSVKEIQHTLRTELKITLTSQYVADNLVNDLVPKLLLLCYPSNIARYLGYPKAGYLLPHDSMRKGDVHPSSTLAHLDHTPTWVIFETVLITSRDFLLNITPVPEHVIHDAIEQGVLDVDLNEIESRLVTPLDFGQYLGHQVMWTFTGPRFANLKQLQSYLMYKVDEFTTLEKVNDFTITCHLPRGGHSAAKKILEAELVRIRNRIENETLEMSVEANSGVRLSFQSGCVVGQFLLPNEFRSISIHHAPADWTENDVREIFAQEGMRVVCIKYTAPKATKGLKAALKAKSSPWGHIEFETAAQAREAMTYQHDDVSEPLVLRPMGVKFNTKVEFSLPFCLKVEYCRRPRKRGLIIIVKDGAMYDEHSRSIHETPFMNGRIYIGKFHNSFFASNIDVHVNESDVVDTFNKQFQLKVSESEIQFPREKGYNPYGEDIAYQQFLEDICRKRGIGEGQFHVTVKPVRQKDYYLVAFVRIAEAARVNMLRRRLSGMPYRGRVLTVEMDMRMVLMFRDNVYRVVKKDIEKLMTIYGRRENTSEKGVDSEAPRARDVRQTSVFNDDVVNNDVVNDDVVNNDVVNDDVANNDVVDDDIVNDDVVNDDALNEDALNDDVVDDDVLNDEKADINDAFLYIPDTAAEEDVDAGISAIKVCSVSDAMWKYLTTADGKGYLRDLEVNNDCRVYLDDDITAICAFRLRDNVTVEFNEEQLNTGMHRLTLNGDDFDGLQRCHRLLSQLLDSETLELSRELTAYFLTTCGATYLHKLSGQCKVYASLDRHSNVLNLYGTGKAKEDAIKEVTSHIEAISKIKTADISLQNTPGVIKELFKKYGFELNGLATKIKATQLEIQLNRRLLHFRGTDESLKLLQEEVRQLYRSQGEHPVDDVTQLPDCPICFTPVEETSVHVLELCGHLYCQECVGGLVASAIKDRKFPITCATDGCAKPLAIADIKNIKGAVVDRDFGDLITSAMEHFVAQSEGRYKYCITPNCDAIYRATKLYGYLKSSAYRCYKCETLMCTTCHCAYHTGVSCHVHQGTAGDEDYSLRMYIRRRRKAGAGIAECRCGATIEKTSGCNHMTCAVCKRHFCWTCHQFFASGNATYDHQRRCPGKPLDVGDDDVDDGDY